MTIKLNYFFRVDLSVLNYDAGTTTTKTYSFVNKALKDSTSIATYWPILKSVGEVSLRAGETLPDVSLSSIEIDNSIGSFGANRKFSDVLQRYTPIEQTVAIYVAEESTSTDTVTSWVEWGRGVVSDYEATSQGEEPTITFNIRPVRYSETVLTLEINRSMSGMENAPDSSLGKAVPLLIGSDLDCIPIRINADGSTAPTYAIGTCLKSHLTNRTASAAVYAKNELDDWEVCNNDFTDRTSLATGLGYYTLNTYAGRASALGENPSGIVHGIKLRCRGNGLASSTARLSVFILRYDQTTNQVIGEVARGSQDLAVYDAQNAISTNPIDVKIAFDKAVFLSANEYYAVGWSVTGYQVNDMSVSYSTAVTTVGFLRDSTDTASSSGFEWKYVAAGAAPNNGVIRYDLLYYDPVFSDEEIVYTQTGLSFSKVTLFSEAVDSGQVTPPLDNFPILVGGMQGLTTYGGSTIVEKPQDVANLLNYKWNNTSATWVDQSYWDTTTLSSSHYDYLYNGATPAMRSRVARAVFDSKVTFSQIISEVCRGTVSNVGILMNGKSFMYPFGLTETPAADIPPADIISTLSWVQGDISTVVNRAVIKTGRSYLSAPRFFEGQEITGYQFVTDYSATNEAKVAEMTLKSRTLYGDKELANGEYIVWPYPSGGVGAYLCTVAGTGEAEKQGSIIAEYYLARFGSPVVQCSFVVPYSRYRSLRLFNVITFTSPNFPAFFGTEANANDGVVDTGSAVSTVTTADAGYETVRADTYRGLIRGITNIAAMEHSPAIKLDVLVLLNAPFDPT